MNPSAPTPVVQFNKLKRVIFDMGGTLASRAEHRTGRCMPAGRGSARQGEDRPHDAASLHGRDADVHASWDARCVMMKGPVRVVHAGYDVMAREIVRGAHVRRVIIAKRMSGTQGVYKGVFDDVLNR